MELRYITELSLNHYTERLQQVLNAVPPASLLVVYLPANFCQQSLAQEYLLKLSAWQEQANTESAVQLLLAWQKIQLATIKQSFVPATVSDTDSVKDAVNTLYVIYKASEEQVQIQQFTPELSELVSPATYSKFIAPEYLNACQYLFTYLPYLELQRALVKYIAKSKSIHQVVPPLEEAITQDLQQPPFISRGFNVYGQYLTTDYVNHQVIAALQFFAQDKISNHKLATDELATNELANNDLNKNNFAANDLPINNLEVNKEARGNEMINKSSITLDHFYLSWLLQQKSLSLSYGQQRLLQHNAETLALGINNFWQQTGYNTTSVQINKLLVQHSANFNLNAQSISSKVQKFTLETPQLALSQFLAKKSREQNLLTEQENQHSSLSLSKIFNANLLHLNQQENTLPQQVHSYLEKKGLVNSDNAPLLEIYQQYLTNQRNDFVDFTQQGITLTLTTSNDQQVNYQARIARVLALTKPQTKEVQTVKHQQKERKRGTNATNNYDHLLYELNNNQQQVSIEAQPTLEQDLDNLEKLQQHLIAALRPNITLLHPLVSTLVNAASILDIDFKELQVTLKQIYPEFMLQKNNKHLAALSQHLQTEQIPTTWQLYRYIAKVLLGLDTAEQFLPTISTAFADLPTKVAQLKSDFSSLTLQTAKYYCQIKLLNPSLEVNVHSLLLENMPVVITVGVVNSPIQITDTILIADNHVLRKCLTSNCASNLALLNGLR
ncbi:hypothetical protein [Psittacicella hinzii]|uniref:Uncharacterized protein n=1 Tax=Psittacicella hinzii TaxID=2028575 RepID=A0A3A1YF33_9GAMM|nr:hypothetical protein [Psittacicella hinzii]RIY34834.1 hypothetical protein CKF58_07590 [Psittacicella hinzii]